MSEVDVEALVRAIEDAEAKARRQHESGVCGLDGWSCSWCEAES